jgi:PhnB protein
VKQKITPYFTVVNADKFISFTICVFNAKLFKEERSSDGKVQHARLLIDDHVIMLNEASGDYQANVSQVHIYVSNIQETYNLAMENEASSLMEPMLRPHGDRMAGFRDTCGNVWWVAETID